MDKANNPLLDGIISQAQEKARGILDQAKKQCDAIEKDAQAKAVIQVEDERRIAQGKLSQVQFRLDAGKASAKRRAALKRIDDNYNAVMERVGQAFLAFARTPGFKPYLAGWIAEAAIGLDLKEAKVAFSPLSPVDEATLRQAEALVKKTTGSSVTLTLDTRPIRQIGVVLSSLDDKVSYNNQVDIRLRRFDRDIRTMVQEHTWKAE